MWECALVEQAVRRARSLVAGDCPPQGSTPRDDVQRAAGLTTASARTAADLSGLLVDRHQLFAAKNAVLLSAAGDSDTALQSHVRQGYCAGRNRCATSRRRGRSNARNFACRCDCHIARSGANHSDRFTQTRHPDRGRRGFDPAAGRGTRNPYQFAPIRDACCTITAGSATPRWADRVVLATERDIRPLSVLDPLSRSQSQHILEFNRRHARIIVSTSQ